MCFSCAVICINAQSGIRLSVRQSEYPEIPRKCFFEKIDVNKASRVKSGYAIKMSADADIFTNVYAVPCKKFS